MVWARNVNAAEKMWFHRNFQVFDDFGPIESHLLCSQWLFSITWTVHPSSRQKMDMFSTVAECDKNFKSTLQLKFNVFPFTDINQVSVSATRHNKKNGRWQQKRPFATTQMKFYRWPKATTTKICVFCVIRPIAGDDSECCMCADKLRFIFIRYIRSLYT